MRKILLLGRCPPPIGGVANHVVRLKTNLENAGFQNFNLCNFNNVSIISLMFNVLRFRAIHLHISDPFLQAAFAVVCRILRKKLIITYHGTWGRYSNLGNLAVSWSARFAAVPIVQDRQSLEKALKVNRSSRQISTYLPPDHVLPLGETCRRDILRFRQKHQTIFCTNAWKRVFDKYKREIYGISALVAWFEKHPGFGLIISDPSSDYATYLNNKSGAVPSNVLILSYPHDFIAVLKFADCFIRNTSTDGVSLSIFESRALGVPVMASDCAYRPNFCYTYHDISTLDPGKSYEVAGRLMAEELAAGKEILNPVEDIVQVYEHLLSVGCEKKTKA